MKIDIYQYTSPGAIIAAVFQELKKANPRLTMQQWAGKLDIPNSSHLYNIVKDRRKPPPDLQTKIFSIAGFNRDEQSYFRLLVHLHETKDPVKKSLFLEQISKLINKKSQVDLDLDKFRLITEWYHLALLEALALKGFRTKRSSQVAARFIENLSPMEVEQSWNHLQSLNLIERKTDGSFRRSKNASITIGKNIPDRAIQQYHLKSLDLARQAILNGKLEDRYFTSLTQAVTDKTLAAIKNIIDESNQEILAQSCLKDADAVYRINIQAFKLTR